MGKTQLPEQPPIQLAASLRETEGACLALVETEIDVAFSFLRLAEAEINGGNSEHAIELIAKAVAIHNSILRYVGNIRAESETEKRELCLEARKLFEAIRWAERHRRQRDSLIPGGAQSVQV